MRGRKPTPTKLKLLTGNPGKRPINEREPVHPVKIPAAPAHLDEVAKKEWRRITKRLAAVGLVAEVDLATIAGYCQVWSRWIDAEEKVRQFGLVMKGENGFYQSPYLPIANKCLEMLMKYSTLFGFDPSSRSRVKAIPPDAEEDDPLQRLINASAN